MAPVARSRLAEAVGAAKALAHPARLRVLGMLAEGELCVCQLAEVLGLAASTVSAHLAELRRAGLVAERRDGKWVHYRLGRTAEGAGIVREARRLIAGDSRIVEDARAASRLRRVPLEVFCRPATGRGRR